MMKTFQLVLFLGLSSALWMGADAHWRQAKCFKKGGCCMTCPTGWMEIEERCYLFRPKVKNWCDAESDCIAEGGNLASFHDVKELNVIKSVVTKVGNGVEVWLGGYDAVIEGKWKWSDGSPCDVKDWGVEVPNYPDKEDCMSLKKKKVIDSICTHRRAYVCSTGLIAKH